MNKKWKKFILQKENVLPYLVGIGSIPFWIELVGKVGEHKGNFQANTFNKCAEIVG